jgi:hypothetical protein
MTHIRKEFSVAGTSFREDATGLLQRLQPKNALTLRRETNNKKDKNAVAVYRHDKKLGYVPRGLAVEIAALMDFGVGIKCAKATSALDCVCALSYDFDQGDA